MSVDTVHLELWQTPESETEMGKCAFTDLDTCALVPYAWKNRINSTLENVSGVIKLQARLVNKFFKYREIFLYRALSGKTQF